MISSARTAQVVTVYDADHLGRLMLRLDPHSAVAVPLIARGQTLGAITVAWSLLRSRVRGRTTSS